ncbi:MAG: hypothetical protein LBE36_09875 [Flavobacteriaceae bacterium]|jgi:hypothetical protein|nr:hypothetical protein [Flavobacteriaceae bacterium]
MKKNIIIAIVAFIGVQIQAQQSLWEVSRFNKFIDKVNNGETTLKYSDIEGTPYYNPKFLPARLGDISTVIPIRYNSFTDGIEILSGADVYELPKEDSYPKFTFEGSRETLVFVNTYNEFTGYFFELASGKNRLLKKVTTKFKPEIPASNHLIPAIPAKFEKQTPIYFIKTEKDVIKIPKNIKELLNFFPENKDDINSFVKSNKIKLNQEVDLVKLVNFLNR